MKKTTLLGLLLFTVAFAVQAQESKPVEAQGELVSPPKEEVKQPAVVPPKPSSQILGKRVVYGGFFTDFLRAQQKRPFLSLKTPINPAQDLENLAFYDRTDKVQAIILFSVKF